MVHQFPNYCYFSRGFSDHNYGQPMCLGVAKRLVGSMPRTQRKSWKIIKISSQHLALLFLSPFFPGAKSWRFTRPPRNKLNGLSAHCRRPELWHPQLKTNCFGIMSSPKSRQKHQTPMTSRRKLHQTDWRIAVVPWGPVDCRGHTWNATGQRRWRGWRVAPANLPPETSQGMQGALYWIYQQSIWF